MAESHWARLLRRMALKQQEQAAAEKPALTDAEKRAHALLMKLSGKAMVDGQLNSNTIVAADLLKANQDIIKGMGVPPEYFPENSPPTTIPFGDDYEDVYEDVQWKQEYLNSPPPTTIPIELYGPAMPDRTWDNQREMAEARRRGDRYSVVYRWDLSHWAIVDVTKKPGEVHMVSCPFTPNGSWDGVERSVAETVCEHMNREEKRRLALVKRQAEADRKAAEEQKKIDLGKPMRVRRPWHKERP